MVTESPEHEIFAKITAAQPSPRSLLRVVSDGETDYDDSNFSDEVVRIDWLYQTVAFAEAGERVQLIETLDDQVIAEEIKDN